MYISSSYWFHGQDASVGWRLVRWKWNANRANKVFSIYNRTVCSEYFCFLILLLDLPESWNCPTKSPAIQRGLWGESDSTIILTQTHNAQCMFIQEFKSHNCCSMVFLNSLWVWYHLSQFHPSLRLLSQRDCLTRNRSLLTLLNNLLSGVFMQEWLKY